MLKLVDTETGREFEIRAANLPRKGDYHLCDKPAIGRSCSDWVRGDSIHHILSPIPKPPKRHTFGGVVFEETGEERSPGDEWYISKFETVPIYAEGHDHGISKRVILRPVEVVTGFEVSIVTEEKDYDPV